MKYNKGFAPLMMLLIITSVLVVGGVAYFVGKNSNKLAIEADLTSQQASSVPPVCDSSITVLSPNGGEVYQVGQKIAVRWSSCNALADDQVMIILTSIKTSFGAEIATVPNTGSATITIPASVGGEKVVLVPGQYYKIRLELGGNAMGHTAPSDESDNTFSITAPVRADLATFSSLYIAPYSGQWPPVVQSVATAYSCTAISRDVFDTLMTLKGIQKIINGKTFCKYSFSDGGAGHFAGAYTYITAKIGGGTKRVDFRIDWSSCGSYGTVGDPKYDQCKSDQDTFFDNLDGYIAGLM